MHLLDLTKNAVQLYESGTALHLVGPPGVGKSDVLKNEFRAALSNHYGEEFGFHDVLLPTIDAPDLRGFLVPTKDKDGHPTSFYTRSAALPSREMLAKYKRGIFVIDERNAADLLTMKAVAPVVLWGRFGDEYLPGFTPEGPKPDRSEDGWLIVSASNRQADRSGANKAPRHLQNRERQINISPDVTAWSVWAEAKGVHPMLIAFAKAKPGVVFSDAVPKTEDPFCTPRSYMSAAKMLGLAAGVDEKGNPNMVIPINSLVQEFAGGDIGEHAVAELFSFLKLADQLPTIDEILAAPATAKCPKELSSSFAAAQMLVHFAKPDVIDKLWIYAERLIKEVQVSTAKSLIEKGGGALLNSQALGKWIMANKALITASSLK